MDFFLVADPSTDGDDNLPCQIDIAFGLLGDFQYTAARGNTIYVYRDPMNNCLFSRGAVAGTHPFCSAIRR